MFSNLNKICTFIFIFIILISLLYVPIIYNGFLSTSSSSSSFVISLYDFVWPIPGYTNISSPFGERQSPTSGASTYHSGIDIPAPEGTSLYAIENGEVVFASWGAGGGYTITIDLDVDNSLISESSNSKISVSYCHVSPIMFVSVGDYVEKNDVIGSVGPKNVYNIINNPYVDSSGNPTNGATTGCHLHFTIKINRKTVDPLNYYILQ